MSRDPHVFGLRISAKQLPRPLVDAARRSLERWLGFERFNSVYSRTPACDPRDFSREFLAAIPVHVEFDGQPVDTIPKRGPLVVVANHAFGLVDGMALDALVLSVRPDAAGLAAHQWAEIPDYRDRFHFVGERGSRRRRSLSVRGWRAAFRHVRQGGASLVFPGGVAARFQWRRLAIADDPWTPHVATLIRQTDAQVLPVYFHGRNGWMDQVVGMVAPTMQGMRLVKSGRTLRATIGRLIGPGELSHFATDVEAVAFLRQETEKLALT